MIKIENEKNGLIQSQESLYGRIRRINHLFKIHFSSLVLSFLFAMGNVILWTYLLVSGQVKTELSQRYGLFGIIVTIIQTIVLFILIIQIGIQILFYRKFIIRGNNSLKQSKDNRETRNALYSGIAPYISNFYAFFNRYSKEKTNLSKLVSIFLYFNSFWGFYVIIIFTSLLDADNGNFSITFLMVILFLLMVIFWIMNLMTSFKIRSEIMKWEKLFPKLEEWAQELEQFSLNNSIYLDEEENQ